MSVVEPLQCVPDDVMIKADIKRGTFEVRLTTWKFMQMHCNDIQLAHDWAFYMLSEHNFRTHGIPYEYGLVADDVRYAVESWYRANGKPMMDFANIPCTRKLDALFCSNLKLER